jgi:hypothetical protein
MHTEAEPPKKAYEYTRIWGIALKTDAVERLVLGGMQALDLKTRVIFDHLTECCAQLL